MEIPLRGRVQTSATKNGDRLKVILPKSHFTRAPIKPEERKTEESLAQALCVVERKVAGSILTDAEVFSGHSSLRNLAIMMEKSIFHVPIQSWLCKSFVNVWQICI